MLTFEQFKASKVILTDTTAMDEWLRAHEYSYKSSDGGIIALHIYMTDYVIEQYSEFYDVTIGSCTDVGEIIEPLERRLFNFVAFEVATAEELKQLL